MIKYKIKLNDEGEPSGVIAWNEEGKRFSIPEYEGNRHWQQYLVWLQEGGTPEPAYTEEELVTKQELELIESQKILINDKMKQLAIKELQDEGKLPLDYKEIQHGK